MNTGSSGGVLFFTLIVIEKQEMGIACLIFTSQAALHTVTRELT